MTTRHPASLTLAILAVGITGACRPELGERDSHVTRTIVLAVRAEPAEVRPGEAATYETLVATVDGPLAAPTTSWAYCATPKALTENGAVSTSCLGEGVRSIGDASSKVSATMPTDACSLFGPEIASAELRPRDPDVTGGFYQPLRVIVFDRGEREVAFGAHRVRCRLSNAGAEVATAFDARYASNDNPELLPIEARIDGAVTTLDGIPRGARVTFRAAWPETSAEPYVALDVSTQTLVDRRETMRVSWFSTAGTFASDRTGRAADDRATFTDNAWTAPEEVRTVHLFAVLRDDRGGVTWSTLAVTTR
jgi:hypothetical protein